MCVGYHLKKRYKNMKNIDFSVLDRPLSDNQFNELIYLVKNADINNRDSRLDKSNYQKVIKKIYIN